MSVISEMVFFELIRKLEFALDIQAKTEQLEILHERFKNSSEQTIKKAIDYLIDNYSNKYNKFPQVAEFLNAIKEGGKDMSEPTQQDLNGRDATFTCQVCRGVGRYVDEKKSSGGIEVFCQCNKGQRLQENRQVYFQERREYK